MEESVKIKKELLLEKIGIAYENKDKYFNHLEDIYGQRLFRRTRSQWQEVGIRSMRDWLTTYEQAVERRSNFSFDLRDFF